MRELGTFLLVFLVCRAEQLPIRRYTTADGLAGNRIESIFRDSRGFLWFGTTEGLSRFDGYQFTNFTMAEGLPSNNVPQIMEAHDGIYWIATSAGPCRFDPARRGSGPAFMLYPLHHLPATALVEDHNGAIWCGTTAGLFRLPNRGTAFEPVDIGIPVAAGGDRAVVSALLVDSQQTLWVGTGGTLYRLVPDGQTSRYTVRDGLPFDFGFVEDLLEDRKGQIWIATRKGICRTMPHPPPGQPPIAQVYDKRAGLPGPAWTESLFQSSDGKIWAGAGGLNLFTGRTGASAFRAYGIANGLAKGSVYALAEDRSGNLWIGTDGNGAEKLTRNGFVGFDERDGLRGPPAAILESRQGELAVVVADGSGNRIVEWFDGRRFNPARPAFPASIRNFGWGASQVAIHDRAGDWWFATGQGVCRFPSTVRIADLANLRPKAVYTEREGLQSNDVFRIFEDSRSDIWIATHSGLARWRRTTKALEPIRDVPGTATAFAEDGQGDIWIGTYNGWLGRIRQDRWNAIPGFGLGRTGMISCIHRDRQGRLWVGTNGPGLFRIDDPSHAQPTFVRYTVNGISTGLRVSAITEDRRGRLWVASAHGVDCLDVSAGRLRVEHYSAADGLPEGEGRLAFCDRSGALWIAMQHGLSRLVPDEMEPQAPPVFVTGVRVAGSAHPISDLGETELHLPDLRPGQNQVEIEFGGFQFAAGEALLYQFGMEGDTPEWGPLAAGRSVNYAGLRPGSYRFRVRAVNSAGVASPAPAAVNFVIMPPFWQRWWFACLVACAVAALVYGVCGYRLNQVLKLESVRMRIATDLHDDIGASLSHIAVLSEMAGSEVSRLNLDLDGQRLNAPLARIGSVSRELIDSMSDIVWATSPRKDRLRNLTERMREFAGEVLGSRSIEFHLQTAGLDEEMKLEPEVRRQVFLIFKECINNILRHSGSTEVTCEFGVERGRLVLKVRDNGRGFDSEPTEGHGLISMRRRAESLGGTVEITAEDGKGVIMVLRVASPK